MFFEKNYKAELNMADPKYANLPGIVSFTDSVNIYLRIMYIFFKAIDQPDIYETDDLPESDQHLDFDVRHEFKEFLSVKY